MIFTRAMLWLVLGVFLVSPATATASDITFARDTLDISTQNNWTHSFRIELAITPQQRAHGLMFRQQMADDEGMLFLFDREALRSFWMKNTYLALDIIFLDREGTIVSVAQDAIPLDETPISSTVPAVAVLEVLAGTTRRLNLGIGDRVLHRAFAAPPGEETES